MLGFDPLPPVDTIYSYVRPERYCLRASRLLCFRLPGSWVPEHRGLEISDQLAGRALSLARLILEGVPVGFCHMLEVKWGVVRPPCRHAMCRAGDTWELMAAALTCEGRTSLNRVRRVGGCWVPSQGDRPVAAV